MQAIGLSFKSSYILFIWSAILVNFYILYYFRARKEEKNNSEKEKKAKEVDDAKWKDDDKHLQKKQVKTI